MECGTAGVWRCTSLPGVQPCTSPPVVCGTRPEVSLPCTARGFAVQPQFKSLASLSLPSCFSRALRGFHGAEKSIALRFNKRRANC